MSMYSLYYYITHKYMGFSFLAIAVVATSGIKPGHPASLLKSQTTGELRW